jgi:Tfp pilus assembly protein PilX
MARTLNPGRGRWESQGVALIITLLLLFLLSVIGLVAVVSSSSDLMINGYYRNYRGTFYAADSGLNMARQEIYNYFGSNSPATFPATQGTTCTAAGSAFYYGCQLALNAGSDVTTKYGASTSLNTGAAANAVPAAFKITSATVQLPNAPSAVGSTGWKYTYTYSLTAVGTSVGSENATINEYGSIAVTVSQGAGTATVNTSFAAFGAFIDSFTACQGGLVQGYLTGPMYANGNWNLSTGSSPGYTFTDPVSETGTQFSYYDGGTCKNSSSVPYTFSDGKSVNPSFQSGYNFGVTPIPLPTDSFSQAWAVLDGKGCGEGANVCGSPTSPSPGQPTDAQMNAVLKDVNQNAYPSPTPPSAGVYLPYTCTGSTCSLNSNGGGLYVESNSSETTTVTLSTSNGAGGSSNPSGQVINVAQSPGSTANSPVVTQTGSTSCSSSTSHGHTTYTCTAPFQQVTVTTTPTTYTTVTVDPVANTTTVTSYTQTANSTVTATGTGSCSGSSPCTPSAPGFGGGSESDTSTNTATTTLNLTGVPQDLVNSTPQAATMVYVDGNCNLTGPSSGAAIQNNSMVNFTANGTITQTGSLLYATEPVTTSASGSTPADTLITANENMNQVLGIFTASGNFILSPTTSGANIETDASICMLSSAGETNSNIGHLGTGNSVGAWTVVGGRMENRAASVSMSSSNTYFDRRFQHRANFGPPWFPATSVSQNMLSSTLTSSSTPSTPSRTSWQYQAGQ